MTLKTTQKPTDLLKLNFEDYLAEIEEDLSKLVMFGMPLRKKIPNNVNIPIVKIEQKTSGNNIFQLQVKQNKDGDWFLTITKLLNAKLKKIKPVKCIHNNKTVIPNRAYIQLTFITDNNEISEPVILDEKAKSNYREFNQAINKSNNRIISKFDDMSFCLFMENLNKLEKETVLSFTNAGRVNYKDLQGRLYKNAYSSEEGDIIPANEYGEVKVKNLLITLDTSKLSHLPSMYLGEYDVHTELYKLLEQTEKIYKGKIEPFLCLGASILCVYLEEIWDNLPGFPIIYLQGNTKQGKSLIQGVISNIFGHNKKHMSMGNSTDNAIAMKCSSINSTPIAINDYDMFKSQSTAFENNVVHFYETGVREKMYNGVDFNLQPISSTAIYSSNYMPCIKEKIFNRLLPLYFPDNGIDTAYISNNYVQDTRRSKILTEVQKCSWTKIEHLIEGAEKAILKWKIFPNKDRESNNVAIAFAGLSLLEVISGYQLPNQNELLYEYCQWYQSLVEKTNTPVDNFLNALSTLYIKKILKNNMNFKLNLIEGRVIFTFDTQECIKLYNSFFAQEGNYQLCINSKTFAKDLNASKYFVIRTTRKYKHNQASSTTLDITDSLNGKYFYYLVTQNREAIFSDKPYKIEKNNQK